MTPAQLEVTLRAKFGWAKSTTGKYGREILTVCPVCKRKKMSVNAKSGKYQCWRGCVSGIISKLLSDVDFGRAEFGAVPEVKKSSGFIVPGELQQFVELDSSHQALDYLRNRKFDPADLARKYGLCYCSAGKPFMGGVFNTTNTIMIPFYIAGELIGWQSRLLYDPDTMPEELYEPMGFIQDEDGEYVKPPKYFTMPGMPKGELLWNYDWARQSQLVVICEGVFDAIRVGRCAVATFGKGVTDKQVNVVNSYWDLAIVLLDPGDADEEILKLSGKVRNCVPIILKGYKDAGEAPTREIWKQINAAVTAYAAPSGAKQLKDYRFIV